MSAAPVNRSDEELTMRRLVADKLRADFPDGRIVHELPLRYSTNRIDVAAIRPEEIIAVEVKSSRDVMSRLEGQLRGFWPVTSQLIVALAPKWNTKLPMLEQKRGTHTSWTPQYTETQAIIRSVHASNIGIWTVDATAAAIEVTHALFRPRFPSSWHLLEMLHVAELQAICDRHRIAHHPRSPHRELNDACARLMTGQEVIKAVCRALRLRAAFGAGSDAPVVEATL